MSGVDDSKVLIFCWLSDIRQECSTGFRWESSSGFMCRLNCSSSEGGCFSGETSTGYRWEAGTCLGGTSLDRQASDIDLTFHRYLRLERIQIKKLRMKVKYYLNYN